MTTLSTNRTSRLQGYSRLENTINQLDMTDIYRTLHSTTVGYTFFLNIHRTFIKRDNILHDEASLDKFKRT